MPRKYTRRKKGWEAETEEKTEQHNVSDIKKSIKERRNVRIKTLLRILDHCSVQIDIAETPGEKVEWSMIARWTANEISIECDAVNVL